MPTLVRTIFAQPSAEEVAAQLARVVDQLSDRFPDVATMLADAAAVSRISRIVSPGGIGTSGPKSGPIQSR